MSDRELLELAAKAAGIELKGWVTIYRVEEALIRYGAYTVETWSPLTNDGDALRLAVKLGLVLNLSPRQDGRGQTVVTYHGVCKIEEPCDDGEGLAARRAIVRAAAEIGKAMQ